MIEQLPFGPFFVLQNGHSEDVGEMKVSKVLGF